MVGRSSSSTCGAARLLLLPAALLAALGPRSVAADEDDGSVDPWISNGGFVSCPSRSLLPLPAWPLLARSAEEEASRHASRNRPPELDGWPPAFGFP